MFYYYAIQLRAGNRLRALWPPRQVKDVLHGAKSKQTINKMSLFYCLEVDYCRPNPCQHGGDCIETPNGFKCHCQAQYKGTHCEGTSRQLGNCTWVEQIVVYDINRTENTTKTRSK